MDNLITKKKGEKFIFISIDICNRSDPTLNVCQNTTGLLRMCLANTDFGLVYGCLCINGLGNDYVTSDPNCSS